MAIPLLLLGVGAAAAALVTAAGGEAARDMKREKELDREREKERERHERESREKRKRVERESIINYFQSGLSTLQATHAPKVASLQVRLNFTQLRAMLEEMPQRQHPSKWMLHEVAPELSKAAEAEAQRDIARLREEKAALRQAREAIASIDPESLAG